MATKANAGASKGARPYVVTVDLGETHHALLMEILVMLSDQCPSWMNVGKGIAIRAALECFHKQLVAREEEATDVP